MDGCITIEKSIIPCLVLVGKVLDIFDLNRDGGLSRKEVAAFLDLDSDIMPLVSESDDSVRRKNMIWLFKKLKSNEYGDLNRQRTGKPLVKVFSLTRKRGLTSDSLLAMNNDNDDDDMRDQPACDSEVLELLSKPDDENQDDLLFTSPESLDTVEPLTVKTIFLYLLIAALCIFEQKEEDALN
ncbi:hypothetical protein QVD17_40261 [Tagetes erecta]|uniref:EF-hand domain-containing protein n=1 Tax=Tagetes erecta TaxID=13708 RepID=A0AAD8NHR8_TARER|nr:hypothetical protein QVD17_40261 [Tagetes erecta]